MKKLNEVIKGIFKKEWGIAPDGQKAQLYTLRNKNGLEISISSYGGIIASILIPDRNGAFGEIVLGLHAASAYKPSSNFPYLGALVGRYANRIAGAKFKLGDSEYRLAANDGNSCIHGGLRAFDKVHWQVEMNESSDENSLLLSYFSQDGEEGFPGNMAVKVLFILSDDNRFTIEYFASTDRETPLNLTSHSYFNLSSGKSATIWGHEVQILASYFTPTNEENIPTGEILSVLNSPLDLRELGLLSRFQDIIPDGYDFNFVLDREIAEKQNFDTQLMVQESRGKLSLYKAASVYEPVSGRVMDISCSQPGIQFYTGNFFDGSLYGPSGIPFIRQHGLTFETQHFPDSVNHAHFPSTIISPEQPFHEKTVYSFSVKN